MRSILLIKTYSMRTATYKTLPLETLYELLSDGIKKLLASHDANEPRAFDAHRKYLEVLITVIEEKKKKELNTT